VAFAATSPGVATETTRGSTGTPRAEEDLRKENLSMITRILTSRGLVSLLATGCVVAGDEEPTLEEIEASCSKDTDPVGDLRIVSLSRDGREISYKSLTTRDRQLLDTTVTLTDRNASGDGACEFYTNGWYCVTDFGECGCEHTDTGPECYCQVGC
jgi:hypothetical protein